MEDTMRLTHNSFNTALIRVFKYWIIVNRLDTKVRKQISLQMIFQVGEGLDTR